MEPVRCGQCTGHLAVVADVMRVSMVAACLWDGNTCLQRLLACSNRYLQGKGKRYLIQRA